MALYKEVLEYYENGLSIPDDVTLMFTDDNFGNIRRLPTSTERKRAGGAGVSLYLKLHLPGILSLIQHKVILSFRIRRLSSRLQVD